MHPRRRIHRVPPQLRLRKRRSSHDAYDPVMFSLGPYHHGKSQLRQAEEFKQEVVASLMIDENRDFYYQMILDRIEEIRSCYVGITIDEYDNKTLARMMLVDACFILYFILIITGNEERYDHMYQCLGVTGITLMSRDVHLLENQVPLWIVELLWSLTGIDSKQPTIYKYLMSKGFGNVLNHELDLVTRNHKIEPFHLLEAYGRTLLPEKSNSTSSNLVVGNPRQVSKFRHWLRWRDQREDEISIADRFKELSHPFRSVTDLEAKGIRFKPTSNCLRDLRFESYFFYGRLHLPIIFVADDTGDLFSNLIAFEMCPETETEFEVTSYVNFMKSLIESPRDVKYLREKGIVFSSVGGDGEVVQMFREIDTYGMDNVDVFHDVKRRIGEHWDSKAKTWMAELVHTYFRTPWTIVALFAAAFLLCLTFVQTYYTARSTRSH